MGWGGAYTALVTNGTYLSISTTRYLHLLHFPQLEHMAQHRLPLTDHRAVSAAIRLFAAPPSPEGSSSRRGSASATATPEEVIALVAALRRVGGRLDVVHYTTAINHAGKREAGFDNKAKPGGGRGGHEGRRDAVVVEERASEAHKGAERARALLAWMAEDGVKPNDVTYTSLIHIFGQVRLSGEWCWCWCWCWCVGL